MSSSTSIDPRFQELRIIDTHVHAFPDLVAAGVEIAADLGEKAGISGISESFQKYQERIQQARGSVRAIRDWFSPLLHSSQVGMRHLPKGVRSWVDEIAGSAPLPGLLIESTPADLLESMRASGIARSLVIPHPPIVSSSWVYATAQEHSEFVPVIHVPKGSSGVGAAIEEGVSAGAVAVKIHPASDGMGPDSVFYREILDLADQHSLPVILHTGCFHSHLIYRGPDFGHPEQFESWFSEFPRVPFILAHMNMHEPTSAIDLATRFDNLWLETSWQPAEAIAEAVRRVGSERVLFGSDWPLLGANQNIGLQRITECLNADFFDWDAAKRILSDNAHSLFKLQTQENP